MFKLNPGTLIGGILTLIGIFGPWFSFYSYSIYVNGTSEQYMKTTAKMSPFTSTFTTDARTDNYYFYDPIASFIGVACIIGAILGSLGEYLDRWKITFIGGALPLLSTLSFFTCLPQNISLSYVFKHRFTLMRHWYLTIFGAILIIFSLGLRLLVLRARMASKRYARARARLGWKT